MKKSFMIKSLINIQYIIHFFFLCINKKKLHILYFLVKNNKNNNKFNHFIHFFFLSAVNEILITAESIDKLKQHYRET